MAEPNKPHKTSKPDKTTDVPDKPADAPQTGPETPEPQTAKKSWRTKKSRGGSTAAEESTSSSPSVRMRRSPVKIGLGVALVALGGLGGAYALSQGGQTHKVVTLRSAVDAGERIEASDLTTKDISDASGVDGIPATRKDSLVGQYSTGNLPAGTLLADGMTSSDFAPTNGQSVIGVGVKPSQRPATGLQPGQRVRLVLGNPPTGSGGGATGGQSLPSGLKAGQTWPAQVSDVGTPADDQTTTVDVTVGSDSATQIATAASTGGLTIVLDPAGG